MDSSSPTKINDGKSLEKKQEKKSKGGPSKPKKIEIPKKEDKSSKLDVPKKRDKSSK